MLAGLSAEVLASHPGIPSQILFCSSGEGNPEMILHTTECSELLKLNYSDVMVVLSQVQSHPRFPKAARQVWDRYEG